MVLCSSRMRWYGHLERKLNVVAQKRSGKPRKSWDEVLLDVRNQRTNGPVNAHLRHSYHFFDVKAYVSKINLAVK